MIRVRVRLLAVLTVTSLALTAGAQEAPGPQEPSWDPDRVPWTRLRFEARKLFLKGTTEIRLSQLATTELDGEMIASPESVVLAPVGPRAALLELRSAFAGRRSESRIWFDPARGVALQQLKRRYGRPAKTYQKIYRYTRDGVFSDRRAPQSAEEGERPPSEWSRVQETFYRHPDGPRSCPQVVDPAILFYLVSAADLGDAGAPVTTCAFSAKTLHRIELRPRGRTSLAVDYERKEAGEAARRQGTVEVLRVVVAARPLEAGSEDSFELLGLAGDVELFLDGRVPVQVSGRLPGLGRVNVRLVEVE